MRPVGLMRSPMITNGRSKPITTSRVAELMTVSVMVHPWRCAPSRQAGASLPWGGPPEGSCEQAWRCCIDRGCGDTHGLLVLATVAGQTHVSARAHGAAGGGCAKAGDAAHRRACGRSAV